MGLTIHYKITAKSEKQAIEGLEKLRQRCLDLPFEEVGEVKIKEITKLQLRTWDMWQNWCTYPNNTKENLRKRDKAMEDLGFSTWDMIKADGRMGKIISLDIWPGEGCEPCDIRFFANKKRYSAQDFCKTQYAVHFLRCHTLVCSMLDIAKEIGFKMTVSDEGNYFKTRDIKILAKELSDYNALVGSVKDVFKNMGWDEKDIVCPLDKNQSIIRIE